MSAFNTALSAASVDITVSSTSGSELVLSRLMKLAHVLIYIHLLNFHRLKLLAFGWYCSQQLLKVKALVSISLEIDKDHSGNIPVGQQSVIVEYVEITSGVSEVITVSGFTGSTSAWNILCHN